MDNTKLVIVESPNKIKKIQSLLGNGYKVMASVGHIRGLPTKSLGVHREDNYRLDYEIEEGKKSVVGSLMVEVKRLGRSNVLLATDPDREGEAIAFHLAQILGIAPSQLCRTLFHELTQKAIQRAISNPLRINDNLVRAQEARRAIDRLAGFEVSQILNQKVKRVDAESFSAGRVQSPALKLIVERERAIDCFVPSVKYRIKASFLTLTSSKVVANYVGEELSREKVYTYLQGVSTHRFVISNLEKIDSFRNPAPPFTTSSLQQDAIKKFKWSSKKVMEVAQSLFEQGHITYMRTDSPNLSEEAIDAIEQQLIINGKSNKFKKTAYKAKENAQEAHEAIRPTHFEMKVAGESEDQRKLYTLIYLRTVASQMIPAHYMNHKITISDEAEGDKCFVANNRTLLEAGFLEMYNDTADDDDGADEETNIDAKLLIGDVVRFDHMLSKGSYTNPPKRFDEAGLVKELEKSGIGRPSTYATILNQVIVVKHYAEEKTIPPAIRDIEVFEASRDTPQVSTSFEKQSIGGDKNKLVPSSKGLAIVDFLNNHFKEMMNYQFTADIEEQLDLITEGKSNYLAVMKQFDARHLQNVKLSQSLPDENVSERKTTQIGISNEGHSINYGKTDKGAYLLCKGVFYNLKDEYIPSLAEAMQLIKSIGEEKTKLIVHQAGDICVKNGQYGYYIEDSKGNKAPLKMEVDAIKKMSKEELKEKIKSYLAWKKNKK